jgi:predicted kinase
MVTYAFLQAHMPAPGATFTLDWALVAFPALRLLAVTPQDPYFHAEGDVWTHTIMVTTEVVNGPDYAASTADEQFILFYAALLHDIAKHDTTVIDPVTGKIGQPGHSRRGALDVRILLWRAGVPFEIREAICRIISVHQVPFFAIAGNKNGQSAEFLIRKLSHELDLRLLSAVAEADMRGRHYEKKADSLVDIELFREMARDEDCYGKPRQFADLQTQIAYFRGASISPDYPHYREPGSKVKVMAGLPASGKDTRVATSGWGLPVISLDDARTELGLKHGVKAGAAIHLSIDRAKEFLRVGAPFVWNATHLSPLMRRKTLDLLYAYHAEVEIIYLEQPEDVIFRRNSKRDTTLSNAAIENMLFRWDPPLPTEADVVTYEVVTA